jgi:hypothetical protein
VHVGRDAGTAAAVLAVVAGVGGRQEGEAAEDQGGAGVKLQRVPGKALHDTGGGGQPEGVASTE